MEKIQNSEIHSDQPSAVPYIIALTAEKHLSNLNPYKTFTFQLRSVKHMLILSERIKQMKTRILSLLALSLLLISCNSRQQDHYRTHTIFTRIDSLRSNYLNIHDSIIVHWNTFIKEDQDQLKLMHKMMDKLEQLDFYDQQKLNQLKIQLDTLIAQSRNKATFIHQEKREAFDKHRMALQKEILITANEITELEKLSKLLEKSEAEINKAKEKYNQMAQEFNQFIEKYKGSIKEITYQDSIKKKPIIGL